MGKAGFILHGARGKVGNIVAQKGRQGNTVIREHVVPKNPQTNKQTAQRIILATVAQAAKFLSPIIDHSFQGKAIGAISKEYFRKINMKKLRALAAIDFMENPTAVNSHAFTTTRNLQALIPNEYIISTGNLGNLKISLSIAERSGAIGLAKHFCINFPATAEIPIYPAHDGVGRTVRLGDMLKSIFGIYSPGEQITFVAIQKSGEGHQYAWQGDPSIPGAMIPYTSMKAVRLFISPTVDFNEEYEIEDGEGQILSNLSEVICENVVRAFGWSNRSDTNLLSTLSAYMEDNIGVQAITESGVVRCTFDEVFDFTEYNEDVDGLGYVYALGIIRSKLMDDGTWQYSNSSMMLNRPSADELYNFGLYWNAAIQAWFESNEVASDELYLRGGNDSDVIGEDFT